MFNHPTTYETMLNYNKKNHLEKNFYFIKYKHMLWYICIDLN